MPGAALRRKPTVATGRCPRPSSPCSTAVARLQQSGSRSVVRVTVSEQISPLRPAIRVGDELTPWQRAAAEALATLGFPPVAWLGPREGRGAIGTLPRLDESAEDLAVRLARLRVDVLVDLSFAPPRLDLAVAVWQLRFGADGRLGPPGGPELARGERNVLCRLIELESAERGRVLVEGRLKTVGHSLRATRQRVLEAVARWPARALAWRRAGLLPVGAAAVCRLEPAPAPEPWPRPVREALGAFRKLAACAVDEDWRIGVIEAPAAALLQGPPPPIRWLPPPPRGWLADPVGVHDGVVLVEAFDRVRWRGFLARTGLEPGAAVVPVSDAPHHLSWPFLVEEGGEIFLLPEASATGRIQLFRAAPFPDRFEPDAVLVEGFAGVDPAVVRHEGHWYLFATDRADQDEARLHLFVAEALRGPWRRHPMSPVVDDLGSARPAGPLFAHEGRLFRPAQDCTRTYGGAVVINRIEALTPELFFETPVARLDPDPTGPCPDGLHSLVAAGARTIVDGKRERRSLRAFRANLRALLAERRARRPAAAQTVGARPPDSER